MQIVFTVNITTNTYLINFINILHIMHLKTVYMQRKILKYKNMQNKTVFQIY